MSVEIVSCSLQEAMSRQPNSTRVVVRALAYNSDCSVLVGRRAQGVGKGLWSLFGGKPDPGEEMEHALLRELREEVGVSLYRPTFWGYFDSKDGTWRSYLWDGVVVGAPSIDNTEIAQALFVRRQEAATMAWAFEHDQVIEQWFRLRRCYE